MGLLETMREAAPEGLWSRGVTLAREGSVQGLKADADMVELRVAVSGAARAFTVNLWPEDEEWGCDCDGKAAVCAHAAAAVIAWSEARKAGRALPTAGRGTGTTPLPPGRAPATLRYHIKRIDRAFRIDRVAVRLGDEEPIKGTLRGGSAGARLLTTENDLDLEEALNFRFGLTVPRENMPRALRALSYCSDILLDGEPVQVSGDPVLPVAIVDDDPVTRGAFRVRLVRDPTITEVFTNGAVRCGPVLRPVSNGGLSAEQRLPYERGVVFHPSEVGKLVSEILPILREKVRLDLRTTRLPTGGATKPRLQVETQRDGEALRVKATVVYGDPPYARVERGELELNGKTVPIRDARAEQQLITEAREELGLPVGHAIEATAEAAVRLVDRLLGARVKLQGDAWTTFRRLPTLRPTVRVDGGRLQVDFEGADPERVIEAWASGAGLVPVLGGWAPLPTGWLDEHGHLLADLLAARNPDGSVARHAQLDLARLAVSLDQPPPPVLEPLRVLAQGFEGIPVAPLPADLRATLRPYQQEGVSWLAWLKKAGVGGVLADDMGLGKTLQALCTLEGRSLVVAPTSVLPNWAAEARKFRPSLKVCTYHGPSRSLDHKADLVLTSYALLRLDIELLAAQAWDTVILDEAQAIKNPDAQVARAAYRLQAERRLTLTGTPVENRLEELWSQFHFVNPGYLGGRKSFVDRYATPIQNGEAGAAARLRDRIRPFVLRRMKEEVARDLPPRTDMVLHCELSAKERAVYDTIRAATKETVLRELGQGGSVMKALEALLRLRQAACHSALVPGQKAAGSAKVDLLVETLDEVVAEGHKALVFSQWTSLLDLVEPELKAAGIPFIRLDGSTNDREAVVQKFQSKGGPPVFLLSLKAGGVGLNLTAADHVFLLDPWWNPAVEDQAADRAHRLGQDKPVMVYRLVSEDTVEERILSLQERKRALADAALGEADRAGSITRDELLALLD
jgi:superfamily II DNA or RNA helicase